MPVMPSLKPLIQAAALAYQDLDSVWVDAGASPDDKPALVKLAELELEGDTETQNQQLAVRLGEIKDEEDECERSLFHSRRQRHARQSPS